MSTEALPSYYGILRERITDAGDVRGPRAREAALAMRYASALKSAKTPPPSPEDYEPVGFRAREAAREMVDELDRHGIQFEDYHPGNVGTRGGLLCLFDLSLAKGAGRQPDPRGGAGSP